MDLVQVALPNPINPLTPTDEIDSTRLAESAAIALNRKSCSFCLYVSHIITISRTQQVLSLEAGVGFEPTTSGI